MKVHLQRLLALFMVLVLSPGLSVSPALAADYPVTSTGSFWQALAESSPDIVGDIIGGIPLIGEDVCSVSEDRRHHGKVIKRPADWAYPSTAWVALCDYCGDSFIVFDDDMQRAYDEHVGNMQTKYGATNINSAGLSSFYLTGWTYKSSALSLEITKSEYPFSEGIISKTEGAGVTLTSGVFTVPVSGKYTFVWPLLDYTGFFTKSSYAAYPTFTVYQFSEDGNHVQVGFSNTGDKYQSFTFLSNLSPLRSYYVEFYFVVRWNGDQTPYYFSFERPYIQDVQAFPSGSNIVSTGTRVGTFSGNFGYYGDNGQMINAENVKIVDETNNTYYNPTTGQSTPITDWTYD